ncbi:acyltransferase family protein [Aureimonas phyllosphaerae]|uniref:Putative solute:sodium symporter small subunit n=1 Tax=Aureimonas phyllosphaerae TaxID=1166078 RepID=A0A7W6FTT9_9HYPH|nr:acyltransferase [Aureimonas phyllosphaerae]MBB3935085.1 putative solute:sodium symporter small subunit [Aureimonas phyllosphaerae]MBB3959093.1 putative solute:sodium symporter small subunit [Aureimonas phyllosphaerae]SFF08037.1 putative solute:sodium symporter small subunit [Aureimonas phyllosphaerae]
MPQLAALTSLRFFAALSIAIFHLQGIGFGAPYEPLALGVSFFFVLSGFVLTYAYGGRGDVKLRSFFVNRLARIWPAHLVTAAVALAFFHSGMIYSADWYPYVLTNLFMLHAWVPTSGHVFSLNAVTWSISAEMAFYAAFPLVLMTRKPLVLFGAVLGATIASVVMPDYGPVLGRTDMWALSPQVFIQQSPMVRFVEFVAGVMVGRLWLVGWRMPLGDTWMTVVEILALGAVFAFGVTALTVRGALGIQLRELGLWYSQSGGFVWFCLLVFVFAHQDGAISRALGHPTLVLLGKVSFSFYMVHLLVMMWAQRENWVAQFGYGGAGFAITVLSAGAAFALWYFVEVPAQRLLTARARVILAKPA